LLDMFNGVREGGRVTESSDKKKPTREELTAILSRFKDVTKPGTGELFIGGVRPPRIQEEQPDESMKKSEGRKTEES
jgi:hypothetical protein